MIAQDLSQAVLDSRDYQYDAGNNIVEQIIREGKLAYQYNNLDRLSQVNYAPHSDLEPDYNHNTTHPPKNENYSYDPVGNRLSSHQTTDNWSYNNNNELQQYTQDGQPVSFQYNANGQLIQKTINAVNTYYAYNLDGRLQTIKDNEQKTVATYTYDPFGRRISKTLYTNEIAESTVYYFYSDEGLIAEYTDAGELIQSYGYAPDSSFTTNPLYSHRPDFADSSGYVYYINDHLGTPKKLITNTGRIVWFGEAEAFGETELVKDEYPNPLRFPGQYLDGESGLHYNFFRYYDSQIGRYVTSDPIGLKSGINTYGYVLQNPLKHIDPFGLKVQICCRPAEIAGGAVDHCWVRTDDKDAGMGGDPNIRPGDEYEMWGVTPVYINDHSNDTATHCTDMNNVDEECVNDKLDIGKPLGRFAPPYNHCQSFAWGTVNSCRTGPQQPPVLR